VNVDRTRILQAFTKLVAYALRVTGDGGHLQISVSKRDHDVAFFLTAHPAAGATFSPPEEGRGGLALLLARGIVELHGGRLSVEARDHVRVTITLSAA
jgi:two-component sensor histidine kinase